MTPARFIGRLLLTFRYSTVDPNLNYWLFQRFINYKSRKWSPKEVTNAKLKEAVERRLQYCQAILDRGTNDLTRITKSDHPNIGNIKVSCASNTEKCRFYPTKLAKQTLFHNVIQIYFQQRSNDTLPLPKFDADYRSGISSNQVRTGSADDLRLLHHRAKEAQNRKARALRDLEENHPYFDRPLLLIRRGGRFRKFCKQVVNAKWDTIRNI